MRIDPIAVAVAILFGCIAIWCVAIYFALSDCRAKGGVFVPHVNVCLKKEAVMP